MIEILNRFNTLFNRRLLVVSDVNATLRSARPFLKGCHQTEI